MTISPLAAIFGSLLALILFSISSAAQSSELPVSFTAELSLERPRILQGPTVNLSGKAVAYISNNPDDNTQIKAYKPAGILSVWSQEQTIRFDAVAQAYDPVWSADGEKLAVFSGFGQARSLRLFTPAKQSTGSFSIRIPGEKSRKSALHFKPVWLPNSEILLIAEAEFHDPVTPQNTPYSLSSNTAAPIFDRHFRDDTLWKLISINAVTGKTRQITSPMPLRHMEVSPDGSVIFISVADISQKGQFMGDTYMRPLKYFLLPVKGGKPKYLNLQGISSPTWDGSKNILFRQSGLLKRYNIKTGKIDLVTGDATDSVEGYVASEKFIAVWHKLLSGEGGEYLIPPPVPTRVSLFNRANGQHTIILQTDENHELLKAFWTKNGQQLVMHSRNMDTLSEEISLCDPDKGTCKKLFSGQVSLSLSGAGMMGDMIAFSSENATGHVGISTIDLQSGKISGIYAADFRARYSRFVRPQILAFTDAKGQKRRALIYLPPKHQPDVAMNMIVTAYGRLTDRANRFQSEAQMHVARGYAYLMPDVFVYRHRLDKAYLETIPAAVKAARDQFGMKGKTGFYGGSLGGFAGLTLMTKNKVIDAAALRAAPSEFALSWATGKDRDADLLTFLMSGKTPFDDKAAYDVNSPLWFADHVSSPLLLLHGDQDMQVPVEQGIWMYQSLRRLGKDVELRIYPGADHSITRANRKYYLDYYNRIFRWWEVKLGPTRKSIGSQQ
ncbi:MAG: hypothetical protein COB49_01420 [Alphaproteobacteria bacterium]|nr:MAG: hypothetical protein COB49_01420 [Alphaproteobacteria bacterium]